jgi:uracil-DNA glycosylase family 4
MPTEVTYDSAHEDGSPAVDILVVGEFPNQQEENNQSVIGSKGGWELRNMLRRFGLDQSVAYTYMTRCRPFEKDWSTREPTSEETAACVNHVWEDIRRYRPKVVVLLGQLVTRAMSAYPRWHEQSIQAVAGETHTAHGVTFFPVPSPYLWAFDKNTYAHRKRLERLVRVLKEVLANRDTPHSSLGMSWYCGTIQEVKAAIKRIRRLNVKERPWEWGVGLDTEGQNVCKVAPNGLSCVQLAPSFDLGYVIPIDHHDSPWTPEEREQVVDMLRDLFTDDRLGFECWVAHEAKFDLNQMLRALNIKRFAKPTVDPIFLAYLEDENLRATSADDGGVMGAESFVSSFNLKTLLMMWCNFRHYDNQILKVRTTHEGFWKLPMRASAYKGGAAEIAQKFIDYSGMDAYGALRLAHALRQEMDSRGYVRAYTLALLWGSRVTHLMRSMEKNGVFIDREMLDFIAGPTSPITARLSLIPDEMYEYPECQEANARILSGDKRTSGMNLLFGQSLKVFDIRKKDHLLTLFVDVCGLDPVEDKQKLQKTGKPPAMDRHFYAKHDYHPLVQLMQEHSGLFKLQSSYVKSMQNYLTSDQYPDNLFDGRLHASFSHTKTLTGRLASSSPSIHQIPRGDNFAKQCIKSLLAAPIGYCIIEGDYAQAEVRWWAQLSGDTDFADMFWRMLEIQETYYKNPTEANRKRKELECDVHRQVAALMFNVDIADVTKAQRQAAKSIVFGCIYGQTAMALAQILKITEQQAEELQMKFIGRFKKAGPWLTWIEEEGKRLGYVEAPNGRRRHVGPLFDIDEGGTRRQCRNSPIQAIASDVMAEAAYLQQHWIEDKGYEDHVKIINLVHDAILQQTLIDLDLIREVIAATTKHMMEDVGPVIERDYGCKLIVPMVADFKMGLRWGHAEEWDRGESLETAVHHMQEQTAYLQEGHPFWHLAVKEEVKKAAKEEKKISDSIEKATGRDLTKLQSQLARHRKHQKYLQTVLPAA